jgi:hypothetical protein
MSEHDFSPQIEPVIRHCQDYIFPPAVLDGGGFGHQSCVSCAPAKSSPRRPWRFLMQQLTGLFLGAGASYEAGLPLVWELTDEFKKWLTPEKLREFNQGWRIQGGGGDRAYDCVPQATLDALRSDPWLS